MKNDIIWENTLKDEITHWILTIKKVFVIVGEEKFVKLDWNIIFDEITYPIVLLIKLLSYSMLYYEKKNVLNYYLIFLARI